MGREKPMIGLSLETPGPDQQGAGVSGGHYVPALTEAGGDVRLLPPAPPSDAMALVSEIDGLCLSGGGDMNPSHYGEALSPLADGIDDARDERELALMRAARGRGIPTVSYTHLRAHETVLDLVCRLLLEKKKKTK